MGSELARWMVALGSVGSAVGLVLLGMGTSYVQAEDGLITLGLILMVGGLVVAVIGGVVLRSADRSDETRGSIG